LVAKLQGKQLTHVSIIILFKLLFYILLYYFILLYIYILHYFIIIIIIIIITVLPSGLWYCWLSNRKGIWPIKATASKPLGMVVNASSFSPWYHVDMHCSVSACLVTMLSIRMIEDWESRRQVADPRVDLENGH